jgi:hypothetical protein
MTAVQDAVYELTDRGVQVLSPSDPRVVDQFVDFVFVASDRLRNIGLVEDRHLAAIDASDFVWLVCVDGYIGQSAAMEIGWARKSGVPIYCCEVPSDLSFRPYVNLVSGISEAIHRAHLDCRVKGESLLIDPDFGIERARRSLDVIESGLKSFTTHDTLQEVRHAMNDLAISSGRNP